MPKQKPTIASSMSELQEQMVLLRDLTRKTGAIHEAQALHLKIWPRVQIDNCTFAEAHVDTEACSLKYLLTFKGRTPAKKLMTVHLSMIFDCVQWLLGDEWSVSAYRKDGSKQTLLGERRRKAGVPDRKKYAGTDYKAGMIVPEKPWQFPKQKTQSSSISLPRRRGI